MKFLDPAVLDHAITVRDLLWCAAFGLSVLAAFVLCYLLLAAVFYWGPSLQYRLRGHQPQLKRDAPPNPPSGGSSGRARRSSV